MRVDGYYALKAGRPGLGRPYLILRPAGDGAIARADFRVNVLPPNMTFTRASAGTVWTSAGNENTNPRQEGAVIGTFGSGAAQPTGYPSHIIGAGLILEIIALPLLGTVTGVRYRVSGIASTNDFIELRLSSLSATTTGTMRGSAFYRFVAGSYTNFSSIAARFSGQTPSTPFPLSTNPENITLISHEVVISNARVFSIRLGVVAASPVDLTFDVFAPQIEFGPVISSRSLPPVGSPAISTRAADSAVLNVVNGTYDVLVQDTAGGEWRPGEVVSAGTYAITPRAGRSHVRRVRLYPPGTAAANPGWAVAA